MKHWYIFLLIIFLINCGLFEDQKPSFTSEIKPGLYAPEVPLRVGKWWRYAMYQVVNVNENLYLSLGEFELKVVGVEEIAGKACYVVESTSQWPLGGWEIFLFGNIVRKYYIAPGESEYKIYQVELVNGISVPLYSPFVLYKFPLFKKDEGNYAQWCAYSQPQLIQRGNFYPENVGEVSYLRRVLKYPVNVVRTPAGFFQNCVCVEDILKYREKISEEGKEEIDPVGYVWLAPLVGVVRGIIGFEGGRVYYYELLETGG